MGRLGWYASRLATMSPAEIKWRVANVGRAVGVGLVREPSDARLLGVAGLSWPEALQAFRAAAHRPVVLDRSRAAPVAAVYPDQATALVAAARRVVDGRVRYFGYPEVRLDDPVDWNHDPYSGTHWPRLPSVRLDHRSAAGDAKWIWELNRLQHLPWLAQAWLLTGDDTFAETAWAHLDSWLAQNPPGVGIAWRGAFEAGVRAISVVVALQGLRDWPGLDADRFRVVVRMLDASARRCWSERSRFSSANNHLVGELAGSAVVSLLLPELSDSSRRLSKAVAALSAEADRQILPDGAGAEQAFAYQLFTGDLLVLVAALLRSGRRHVPDTLDAALSRSARYLTGLVGDGDPVPRYGDDDEGFALRLDAADVPDVRTHLATVGAVTGDPVAAAFGRPGLMSAWLGGADPVLPPDVRPTPGSLHAPDGGMVVLRSGGRRVTVDVGPLGYLAIAAHGHADALAVTLSVDRRELIGDPGAGSYYGHRDWRPAHRSTAAHATVTVDGVDQSVSGGPFLWTGHAGVRVHAVDLLAGVVDAEHDGYERLARPVRHRRWVLAPPGDRTMLVVDLLSGEGEHDLRVVWPLYPDLDLVDGVATASVATRDGVPVLQLLYAATLAGTLTSVRGDEGSNLGWWSDRLESRRPSWVLGWSVRGAVPVALATVLHAPEGAPAILRDPSVVRSGSEITVGWTEDGVARAVRIDPDAPAAVRYSGGTATSP